MADNIPPKLDLRKSGTVQPDAPAASGIPSPSAGLTSKRETSRIPLDAAAPAAGGEAAGEPLVHPSVAKRTTSRISFEAVLGEGAPAGRADGAPKTIRLKRPGESPVIKMAPPGGARASSDAQGGEESGVPPSARRTVRVKRAPGAVPQAVPVARPAGEITGDMVAMAPSESVGAVFPIVAILAIVAAIAVIWMLCAQVFGPDLSLTQLACGKLRGFDLPWPGKIAVIR